MVMTFLSSIWYGCHFDGQVFVSVSIISNAFATQVAPMIIALLIRSTHTYLVAKWLTDVTVQLRCIG